MQCKAKLNWFQMISLAKLTQTHSCAKQCSLTAALPPNGSPLPAQKPSHKKSVKWSPACSRWQGLASGGESGVGVGVVKNELMGGVVQEWGMRSEAQQGLDVERWGQDPYWVWHQYSGGTGRNRWASRTLESSRVQEPVPGKLQLRFMQWGRVNIKHSTDPEGSRTQELVAETLNLWDSTAGYFIPLISTSSVVGNDCKIAQPWLVRIV